MRTIPTSSVCLPRKIKVCFLLVPKCSLSLNYFTVAGTKSKKGGKKDAKSAEMVTTTDDEEAEEVEGLVEEVRPKPKPRPKRKAAASGTDTEYDAFDDNPFLDDPVTPKRLRPTSTPKGKAAAPRTPSPARSHSINFEGSLSLSEPPMTPERDLFVTPTAASKKRAHTPEEQDEDGMQNGSTPNGVTRPERDSSQEATGEMQIRRKRVRH